MIFLYLILVIEISSGLKVTEHGKISRIAFGSCANQFGITNPDIFYSIINWKPDIYVWLGDIVYADRFSLPMAFSPTNEKIWRSKYNSFKTSIEYQALINSTMITGVYDDHDYGINDGDKNFIYKEIGKKLVLEFLDDGSIRDHGGVYHSFTFEDLKLILLDIRWFRDSKLDKEGDSLGEEQWVWLEKELQTGERVKIIGNGLQVNTFDRNSPAEKWHEKSRLRLWGLLDKYPGVLLLTGDVHYGELLRIPCSKHIVYEITSSGLTHSVFTTFNMIGWYFVNLWQPFNFNIGKKFLYKNFGTIEIDWETQLIHVSVRDTFSVPQIEYTININELYETNPDIKFCQENFKALKYKHILGTFFIILLPFWINFLAILIFLRKYSNSY
ncbi:hypothetical protein SteCoe_32488 [Stentor coeruleus]|uniref:PhoD-like phosphatase metallophosphatase domain-containing protein n=1 Tax=Stentor coeruleus TaxID=5963 RepID=A0A1R2AYW6_9CILI|nr:hypothetical protein SteCoe_32488 [Stentor coeruleus]